MPASLFTAIEAGNLDRLRSLLKQGADVNARKSMPPQ
jgi:hypothetical protein